VAAETAFQISSRVGLVTLPLLAHLKEMMVAMGFIQGLRTCDLEVEVAVQVLLEKHQGQRQVEMVVTVRHRQFQVPLLPMPVVVVAG
jgi:hypothetical protein